MRWVVGLAAALLLALPVFAQKFPSKSVTMIVPYPPGGYVSKAAPDSYTLCLLSSSFTTNAAIQPNLPPDPRPQPRCALRLLNAAPIDSGLG